MSELLRATDSASRVGLVKALERAAAAGRTSTVETLLGALAERFPAGGRGSEHEAIRALNRAAASRRWATVAYLADYLQDTGGAKTGGGRGPYPDPAAEHIEQEVLRCLREQVEQTPGRPFLLTDAIEDTCALRGLEFAREVARITAPAAAEARAEPRVTFCQADPALPPDVCGGAENPCEYYSLANPDFSAESLLGPTDVVVPPGRIAVDLAPPLAGRHEITTDGTRAGVARAIADLYQRLYFEAPVEPARDLGELDLVGLRRSGDIYAVELAA